MNMLLFTSPCLAAAAVLLDTISGTPLQQITLPGPPASLTAAAAGDVLAFGLADGRVVVCELSTGCCSVVGVGGLPGVGVRGVVFTAGGRELVSAAGKIMAMWEA